MAKRRRTRSFRRAVRRAAPRRRARVSGFSAKRSRRSSKSGMGSLTGLLIGSMVYGAGREWLSNKLSPITSKIPAGDLADEVGLGALNYFVAKGKVPFVSNLPYAKEIARAGLTIEAARTGAYLGAKFIPGAAMTQSSAGGSVTNYQQWQ